MINRNNFPSRELTSLPTINKGFLLDFLTGLLNTPSPTGFTHQAIAYIQESMEAFTELKLSQNHKGALVGAWEGVRKDKPRALTAHADTLGAMVKEIKDNGRLKLSLIGNFAWNTVEGESCTVFTRAGKMLRGSLLITKASAHIYGKSEVSDLKREAENMELRLDAHTASGIETRSLGIEVGDYVAFDPRTEVEAGFIRSRYLDDKAGVACVLAAVNAMHDAGLNPKQTTYLHFSNYEEVGHGAASGIPSEVTELVTVDMAVVGQGQTSDEFHTTLCMKDSGGPYHHGLCEHLRKLADNHGIAYKVDIYPHYGSDGEVYWRAGGDVAVALIGPGVDASHNYERTHIDALEATTKWILSYILAE